MKRTTIVFGAVVFILLSAVIFLGLSWIGARIELKNQNQLAKAQLTNLKVADFLELFITKVLKNNKEIIFEERLQLENAVLDLKDADILNQWHKFTESKNEAEAQEATLDLLELLAKKIKQ